MQEQDASTGDGPLLQTMAVGYLAVDRDWRVTDVNDTVADLLGVPRAEIVGADLWQRFPHLAETDFAQVYRDVLRTGVPATAEGYYPPPLDAWYEVRVRPAPDGLTGYFLDVTARRRAEEARERAARRLAGLGQVALGLADARDLPDLLRTVAERGLPVLGCDGGAVAVPDPDDPDVLLSYVTQSYGPGAQATYGRLPLDVALPVAEAALTGRAVLVPDRAAAAAYSPEMAEVVRATGSQAFVSLPLRSGGRLVGVLTAGWVEPQEFAPGQVALLEALGAQCAQALTRLSALEAERAAARRVARISEGLQRSLLAALPRSAGLELVARYVPAADEAQVGGDWYDAFHVRDGSTCLVIGDVVGHDHTAAIAMAQVRNVLRGVAHAVVEPPAAILQATDWALQDLEVDTFVTMILAKLDPLVGEVDPVPGPAGSRRVRWTNAGHPPPLLVAEDGSVSVLDPTTDLLLGVDHRADRRDLAVVLPPGSTLLLYTDGLVERRHERLQDGLERLRTTVADVAHLPLESLCDAVVDRLAQGHEDDVALLAVRVSPAP